MKEEELIHVNYLINFISEIEDLNNICSSYTVFRFNLENVLKKESRTELTNNEKQALLAYLNDIRVRATKIYLKYDVIKESYKIDLSIDEEYKKLFENEDITTENLKTFIQKLNKVYFMLYKEVVKVKEKITRI